MVFVVGWVPVLILGSVPDALDVCGKEKVSRLTSSDPIMSVFAKLVSNIATQFSCASTKELLCHDDEGGRLCEVFHELIADKIETARPDVLTNFTSIHVMKTINQSKL